MFLTKKRSKSRIVVATGAQIDQYAGARKLPRRHRQLYSVFRDYIKHEDDLINYRLNWNFTIQGFLFAACSFTLQKVADLKIVVATKTVQESARPDLQRAMQILKRSIYVMGGLGISVSVLIFVGAFAAFLASKAIEEKWLDGHEEYRWHPGKAHSHGRHLPGVAGGGNCKAPKLGFGAPLAIPVFFVGAWLILLSLTRLIGL